MDYTYFRQLWTIPIFIFSVFCSTFWSFISIFFYSYLFTSCYFLALLSLFCAIVPYQSSGMAAVVKYIHICSSTFRLQKQGTYLVQTTTRRAQRPTMQLWLEPCFTLASTTSTTSTTEQEYSTTKLSSQDNIKLLYAVTRVAIIRSEMHSMIHQKQHWNSLAIYHSLCCYNFSTKLIGISCIQISACMMIQSRYTCSQWALPKCSAPLIPTWLKLKSRTQSDGMSFNTCTS